MDLTSLSSTLPGQSRNSQYEYPLMSAFKQAAMSVTTLYKSANTEIVRARKQGYQDALNDLLHLINSDRIYTNSEVIKIREWGLSRRRKSGGDGESGACRSDPVDESEDERGQSQTAPSSSPIRESEPPVELQPQEQHAPSEPASSSSYDNIPASPSPPKVYHPVPKEIPQSFSFRSNHHLPKHVPPPPRVPYLEDIELPDTMPDSPMSTSSSGEQALHHINHRNFSPSPHRNPSGAWKRRFPLDFLELAAMAEKEKAAYAGMEFNGNKRGRMT
ncbi:hypothetical protein L211DRAFT_870108 [Terfezia boudieri ATCC MYA-4762]|uniref:Uncharacterized protein n=1 Tax=Terfezia boudieri ATCC MYA-4762 TaxID=1051890 RepID=A0A3N4LII3_9PEZI|nr:hypothetical protein L211DRAFT_870108 [Terfezia boudieri ATCC MYA-4762]